LLNHKRPVPIQSRFWFEWNNKHHRPEKEGLNGS
jgi:hypothetical protein